MPATMPRPVLVAAATVLLLGSSMAPVAGAEAAAPAPKFDVAVSISTPSWSALGANGAGTDGALNGEVIVVAAMGSDLYFGGSFTNAAGIPEADYIARWDGANWHALGSNGAGDGVLNRAVEALAASGNDVYVGGTFWDAAGIAAADSVAHWDGTQWQAMGSNPAGDDGAIAYNNWVASLAVSGSDVYVGGGLIDVAGIATADGIARWDGSAWHALGSNGAGNGMINQVTAIADVGGALIVGGYFSDPFGHIARWNGSTWSALGPGGSLNDNVFALAPVGPDLYVGGNFTDAGGVTSADYVARWNGSGWSALGSSGGDGAINGTVRDLLLFGTILYAAGGFSNAAVIAQADYVARYGPLSYRPDGRIRKGTGTYLGNNIYGVDGTGQTKTGAKSRGSTIKFGISVQNDGTLADRFRVLATGAAATMYTVTYFSGMTDITSAVVAGTYQTPALAPGATYLITAKVKVKSNATRASSVTRLVTITSLADLAKVDAVKFIGQRS